MYELNAQEKKLIVGLRCCSSGERNCDACTYNYDVLAGHVITASGCDLLEERAADLIEKLLGELNRKKEKAPCKLKAFLKPQKTSGV